MDLAKVAEKHDEQREREVQALVEAVLDTTVDFWDNPNGGYEWTCPLCSASVEGGGSLLKKGVNMLDIAHHPSCAYLIARGLRVKEEKA